MTTRKDINIEYLFIAWHLVNKINSDQCFVVIKHNTMYKYITESILQRKFVLSLFKEEMFIKMKTMSKTKHSIK